MPLDADPINVENNLGNLPPGEKMWHRPWYFYDRVDPVPQFRHVGPDLNVSRGDYVPRVRREDMTGFYEEGAKPVRVYGYE